MKKLAEEIREESYDNAKAQSFNKQPEPASELTIKQDLIILRRVLNQAAMDKTTCFEIDCYGTASCCYSYSYGLQKPDWWTKNNLGYIPCFVCSHNINTCPIHPQDPLQEV